MISSTGIGRSLGHYVQLLKDSGLELSNSAFIAGGAIRRAVCGWSGHGIEEGDIDIYCDLNYQQRKADITSVDPKGRQTAEQRITGDIDGKRIEILVQLHCGYGNTIREVLEGFDFTCCQMACDGNKVYYVEPAIEHARAAKLVHTGVSGYWTLARAFRLQAMGFKPDNKCLKAMEEVARSMIMAQPWGGKSGRS